MTRKEMITYLEQNPDNTKEGYIDALGDTYFNEAVSMGFLTTNLGDIYWTTQLLSDYYDDLFGEDGKDTDTTKDKKPYYPTTVLECFQVLGIEHQYHLCGVGYGHKSELCTNYQCLLICLDAYHKIANYTPDWTDKNETKYVIGTWLGKPIKTASTERNYKLAFPTSDMRAAFYHNFYSLIEYCKELL